jgi:hypothetical protein
VVNLFVLKGKPQAMAVVGCMLLQLYTLSVMTPAQLPSKVPPAALYCSDVPTNPRSPAKLIRNISNVIDTALGDVDGILDKVS